MSITIVDYGMGNLRSVANALEFLGLSYSLTSDPDEVRKADSIIIPGVGSFRSASDIFQKTGLLDAVNELVLVRERKVLGICLGFQMLGLSSSEGGGASGLGFIPSPVRRFMPSADIKVPHVGLNDVSFPKDSLLFKGLENPANFYFVHSYIMEYSALGGLVTTCEYIEKFVAAYENENVFGVQFHPEKSQASGLRLLLNFARA